MIQIFEDVYENMYEDALLSLPNECCGFLFGHEEHDRRIIKSMQQVKNSSNEDQRKRFSISALDYMYAEKYAEENNLTLLGIYHSHPNHPAIPSETDRKDALPFFSYVIISVMNQQISHTYSWQLNEKNQFEEEPINQFISSKKINL